MLPAVDMIEFGLGVVVGFAAAMLFEDWLRDVLRGRT